ncbi:MAG TPA: alpha/beta fold hydrolase [Acidimicrobiales bacterium]|nr:alpha/beta fold hydrolase [Acidimicrobiales bacterium]
MLAGDPLHDALACEVDGAGPRLVLVHGFTQTARCWGPVGTALAEGHEVVRVDAPGHGRSADVRADLRATAGLLAGLGPATYLGYSMGGRQCLEAALRHPDAVEALVLVSATAGIEDEDERASRRASDDALAARIEAEGVDAFVDHWVSLPLFAGLPPVGRFDAERRTNTAAGLAASLRLAGTGTQEPSWDRLPTLAMPVLVVAGDDDAKFTPLAHRLVEGIGANATLAVVPGAGHTTHLEAPDAFLAVVLPWLADHAR